MRTDELDRPVWAALHRPHRDLATHHGNAARYDLAVAPFAALLDAEDDSAWSDLAALAGGEAVALFATDPGLVPSDWTLETHLHCLQLIETERLRSDGRRGEDVAELGPDDVPDMLELVERTHPEPFLPRTVDLGGYVDVVVAGIRVDAREDAA